MRQAALMRSGGTPPPTMAGQEAIQSMTVSPQQQQQQSPMGARQREQMPPKDTVTAPLVLSFQVRSSQTLSVHWRTCQLNRLAL
mmetsp:Transcript_20655/g.17654  ORF Transcript_20655/g.17654 Transcript_20655/m.17654 type:complete len:84 (+) Transcript_20655:3-254(+)